MVRSSGVECQRTLSMMQQVTWKSVRDRYQCLKTASYKHDSKNRNMLKVGEDFCQINELLISMKSDPDDLLEDKKTEKTALKERGNGKERFGNYLMPSALNRSRPKNDSDYDAVPPPPYKKA